MVINSTFYGRSQLEKSGERRQNERQGKTESEKEKIYYLLHSTLSYTSMVDVIEEIVLISPSTVLEY